MNQDLIHHKAERIRDVIRYLKKFKNARVVIYLDDRLLGTPIFTSHIRDIALLHEAGLKIILVPGAKKRINEVLEQSGKSWTYKNSCRITDDDSMPLIKMAAFDVSNQIMTALAGEKITAVIGNWVRARSKGVIDGFDYKTSGEIDKVQDETINTVLDNGFIPIFPCIGWSLAGKPYNISSMNLAQEIAVHLKADKLFYLIPDAEISNRNFKIPDCLGVSDEGNVPAMNLEELDFFIKTNEPSLLYNEQSDNHIEKAPITTEHSFIFEEKTEKNNLRETIFHILNLSKKACSNGVSRIHILNGSLDGTVPCEIFSDLGSGTMIYASNYGGIRDMTKEDVPSVLNLMRPFIEKKILLPRSKESLSEQSQNYIVYELDGAIRACASLIPYDDRQMEIAGVAVDESCSNMGIGPKIISFLIERAQKNNAHSVFLLTTQTSDWFEKLGFTQGELSSIPEKRRKEWSPQRNSKVMKINLNSYSAN